MAPTNPIGRDPVTGLLTEFVIATSGGIFDCGGPTTTYSGGLHIDFGGVT